jgi:hypothetical protein
MNVGNSRILERLDDIHQRIVSLVVVQENANWSAGAGDEDQLGLIALWNSLEGHASAADRQTSDPIPTECLNQGRVKVRNRSLCLGFSASTPAERHGAKVPAYSEALQK